MFFRRQKPVLVQFDERMSSLKALGFQVQPDASGSVRVSKLGCAAILQNLGTGLPKVGLLGIAVGTDIGLLENGGFQMFLRTSAGRRIPALAEHLRALHDFQEDLKDGLGLTSLYNTSLGTTSDRHMYDRVKDRESNQPKKAWEADVRGPDESIRPSYETIANTPDR
ncbi:MAG: hypothetical protein WKF37_04030 [Bryobacteraceae bacterium]